MILRGASAEVGRGLPFRFKVADVAQRYEVSEVVRLFGSRKGGKANDVMNVHLFPVICLGYAALLALVPIAFTGGAALPLPVRTVVSGVVAAAPKVIPLSAVALVSAIGRAIAKTPRALTGRGEFNRATAGFTGKGDGWLNGRARRNQTDNPRFDVAGPRADGDMFGAMLGRLTRKVFGANITLQDHITPQLCASYGVRTFTATGRLPAVF
jgi:3D (Asp-Asp-Asp) domain-containing protein